MHANSKFYQMNIKDIHDKTEVLTNYRKQNPNTLYKDQKIQKIDTPDLVQASTQKVIKMTSHTKW